MRRFAILACALAALAAVVPARADYERRGMVMLPVPSPNVGRVAYMLSPNLNRATAFVFPLPPQADKKTYTLTRTGGLTGLEDLDAYFYESIAGNGTPCSVTVTSDTPKSETGSICPEADRDAKWAIIILRAGANGSFTFTF